MIDIHPDERETTANCFSCDSTNLERTWRRQTFQYGTGSSAVELTAEMPVYTCADCGYQFAGAEGEEARHEAVCRHLGVLTPKEIVAVRESTGLTRTQFSECTRIGIASLKRWETGALIQNAANDDLIYLMTFPENVERLQRRNRFEPLERIAISAASALPPRHRRVLPFRGRCLTADSSLAERAVQFVLRA